MCAWHGNPIEWSHARIVIQTRTGETIGRLETSRGGLMNFEAMLIIASCWNLLELCMILRRVAIKSVVV